MKKIEEQSIPGNIEYEIVADEQDITQLDALFNQLSDEENHALTYIVNFFDERPVDDNRDAYGNSLIDIYRHIYRLGTEKTKKEIEETSMIEHL